MTPGPALSNSPYFALASSSPRRKMLLPLVGTVDRILPVDVDETPQAAEDSAALAVRLALEKANAARDLVDPDGLTRLTIVAADTVVSLDEQPLGKPRDEHEARSMLRSLRGRDHDVITAVAVQPPGSSVTQAQTAQTRVTMRRYTDSEIEAYIRRGEPFDKAGAYAIQDPIFRPVERIQGCLPNVVGLPLCTIQTLTRSAGRTADTAPGDDTCALCREAGKLLSELGLWSPPSAWPAGRGDGGFGGA